jgi:methionyl-tRNA formyltransferase
MKLIFAGTPAFAAAALAALHAAGHDIALVLTQPDRPAGRGMRERESAVKSLAGKLGLAVAQPLSLKDAAIQTRLRSIAPEAMVVAAYGLILPAAVLAIPLRGCLNIHASLLPRWRGAAPIQRALLAGDRETGITIMQMNEGLDTGDILLAEPTPIAGDDTAATLHDRLAAIGAHCIVRALREPLLPLAQDDAQATYAGKLTKAEALIDWTRSADEICRRIRAYNPVPGASTTLGAAPLKIWRAAPLSGGDGVPGTVFSCDDGAIIVAAGTGRIALLELQKAGAKRMAASAFLAGTPLPPGTRFGA